MLLRGVMAASGRCCRVCDVSGAETPRPLDPALFSRIASQRFGLAELLFTVLSTLVCSGGQPLLEVCLLCLPVCLLCHTEAALFELVLDLDPLGFLPDFFRVDHGPDGCNAAHLAVLCLSSGAVHLRRTAEHAGVKWGDRIKLFRIVVELVKVVVKFVVEVVGTSRAARRVSLWAASRRQE